MKHRFFTGNTGIFILPLFIFLAHVSFAQKRVLSFPCELDFFKVDNRKAVAIPNTAETEFALFLKDYYSITAQLISEDFEIQKKLVFDQAGGCCKNLVGYYFTEPYYVLVFSNQQRKKFHIVRIDFRNNKLEQFNTGKIKPNRELRITEFPHDGKFYLLTSPKKNKAKITFHQIDHMGHVDTKIIDLSKNLCPSFHENRDSLHFEKLEFEDAPLINPAFSTNIKTASYKTKLYKSNNELIITDDNQIDLTKVYRINLDTYEIQYSKYPFNQFTHRKQQEGSSNSFLLNDRLFQVKTTAEVMELFIWDIKNNSIIREMRAHKDSTIAFKNTPFKITVEEKSINKEIDNTSKILKKISRYEAGISVFKEKGHYYISIGGNKALRTNPYYYSKLAFARQTLPEGSEIYASKADKDAYFEGVFDHKLNPLEGVKYYSLYQRDYDYINVFDRIWNLESNLGTIPFVTTVFLYNDTYYYGYYNQAEMQYHVLEFKKYPQHY